jgi:UDP-glucose 4-epimerase
MVDDLVGQGLSVRAFDRFGTSRTQFSVPNVELISGDFMNDGDLRSAVSGVDQVFHMLSTTTPATASADPGVDIRTNIAQTISLLEICAQEGVKRVHFASTGGAIYGLQGKDLYKETDRALPVSPYGIGKLAIEHYLEFFRVDRSLDYVIYRISNPYGPRQNPAHRQGLIPIALRAIRDHRPVIRLGDGTMERDYVYVRDVTRALAPLATRAAQQRLYNVGSGHGLTVDEVLGTLEEVTGTPFAIENRPKPNSFVDRVVLDTSRFESEFGAVSATDLRSGIAETWKSILAED